MPCPTSRTKHRGLEEIQTFEKWNNGQKRPRLRLRKALFLKQWLHHTHINVSGVQFGRRGQMILIDGRPGSSPKIELQPSYGDGCSTRLISGCKLHEFQQNYLVSQFPPPPPLYVCVCVCVCVRNWFERSLRRNLRLTMAATKTYDWDLKQASTPLPEHFLELFIHGCLFPASTKKRTFDKRVSSFPHTIRNVKC